MRNRDFNDYNKGTQNKYKLMVIQFKGWQVQKQSKSRVAYNPHQVKSHIESHLLEEGTELILWYDLFGQNKPVYNKFPVSPDKKQGQTTYGKLVLQSEYEDITHLQVGQYYAVWQFNSDEKTYDSDKPGYWYWTEIKKISSKWAANEIFHFKMSAKFKDKDFPHEPILIQYVDELGRIDGPAMYDYIVRKSGTTEFKPYEEIMAIIDYVQETEVIAPRIQRFLELLNKNGLLQKYLTNS